MKVKKKCANSCALEFYHKEILLNLKFDKVKERKGEAFDLSYRSAFSKDITWNLF